MAHPIACRRPDCLKTAVKLGFCEPHYQASRNSQLGPCVIDECVRKSKARGLCNYHYLIDLAGGTACSVQGCDALARTRGFCGAHYYRWNKTGDAGEAELRRKPPRECKVEYCHNPAAGRDDLCKSHHDRLVQYGNTIGRLCACGERAAVGSVYCRDHYIADVTRRIGMGERPEIGGLRRGSAKENRIGGGYVGFKVMDVMILEHRAVMEHVIGRPLEPFENVHHKNGVRHDNRPENLELWITSQPSGQRPEDLADWMVAHYRDIVIAALAKSQ